MWVAGSKITSGAVRYSAVALMVWKVKMRAAEVVVTPQKRTRTFSSEDCFGEGDERELKNSLPKSGESFGRDGENVKRGDHQKGLWL